MMTAPTENPPTNFEELQLYTGKVLHIVDRTAPRLPDVPAERAPSLCRIQPMWPGEWVAGDLKLPLCNRCYAAKEASERVGEA